MWCVHSSASCEGFCATVFHMWCLMPKFWCVRGWVAYSFRMGLGWTVCTHLSHISVQESAGMFEVLLGVGLISGYGLCDDFWQTLSLVPTYKGTMLPSLSPDPPNTPPRALSCYSFPHSTVFIPW